MASRERFGAFEVDRDAGELRKHGIKIKLPDQPFSVLTSLLDRPGEVVTRDELQRKLWASDTFVDFDRGLNKAMNRLREALGDSAASPQFIETIPKRGYRFIGSLAEAPDAPSTLGGVSQTVVEGKPLATHLDGPPAGRTSRAWIYVAASVAVIGIALIGILKRGGGRPDQLVRSSLLPPPNATFVPYNFVLSPDGKQLAFVAAGQGKTQLWIRALSAAEARPLIGAEGATFPFWAPDNRRLGFFADRKLKTIDETTGVVRTLAEAKTPSGASWGSGGTIVFAPVVNGRLYKVHENGGAVESVTDVRGTSMVHRWPYFLPDGKRFLYVAENLYSVEQSGGIFAGSVDGIPPVRVSQERVRNAIFALDYLFFANGGTLNAQSFDARNLRLGGKVVPLFPRDVAAAPTFFPAGFTISNNGVLAFQSASDMASRLTWLGEGAKVQGDLPDVAYSDPAVSPDGRTVAAACDPMHDAKLVICTYDTERRLTTRVTQGLNDRSPVWSPDGTEIALYGRRRNLSGDGKWLSNAETGAETRNSHQLVEKRRAVILRNP